MGKYNIDPPLPSEFDGENRELDRTHKVIQIRHMSHTLSVRLSEDLAKWVEKQAKATGRSQGSLVKEALEKARQADEVKPFMRLAGCLDGPSDLSKRKGFSRE